MREILKPTMRFQSQAMQLSGFKVQLSGILGAVLLLSACERIPDWEQSKNLSKSTLEIRRIEEMKKWLWTCRAVIVSERKPNDIEILQDHLRAKGLSILAEDSRSTFVSTGFLWDAQGYILVQLPRIETMRDFECRSARSSWISSKLIGVDSSLDMAVLKVPPLIGYPRVNPWMERADELYQDEPLFLLTSILPGTIEKTSLSIQAISPALSSSLDSHLFLFQPSLRKIQQGGIVIDSEWRMVGVSLSSPSQAWGLGLKLSKLKDFVSLLIKEGEVRRPYLGFNLRYSQDKGFEVVQVDVGSSSYSAGIRPDDILVEWNGKRLKNLMDWTPPVLADIGQRIGFRLKRGTQEVEGKLEIGSRNERARE